MYFFELYPDTIGDVLPTLPVNESDLALFGLGSDAPLSWESVSSIALNRGAYRLVSQRIPQNADGSPSIEAVKFAIHAVALMHASDYAAIRATISAQYDPIENYRMDETTTTDYLGGQTTTAEQDGEDSRTTSSLAAQDSTTTPETTTTAVSQAATATNTTERDVVGFDTADAYKHEYKDTTTAAEPERTTTTTESAVTATTDYGARSTTETYTAADRTTTTTFNDRTDSTTVNRHGNIGVTTSQQLLESELVLRAKLNLADRIADDILSELCVANYHFNMIYRGDFI